MPRIARSSIDQVQAVADMVEIVGQYTQLRKTGANYTGRCPFHEEKTPSFSVNPTEKLYYCFGCGAGGNLFGFVQQKENLDFAAAVEHLADKYGIVLEYEASSARGAGAPPRPPRPPAPPEPAPPDNERVLTTAAGAAQAREYLERRGLGTDICRAFRIGYSLPGWDKLRQAAMRKGFTEQELLDAGLVLPGKRGKAYDRFRGRIIFPLADDRGRTLGFGARTMGDEKPKYLNSPETELYHKSEALFGLHNAKTVAGRDDRLYVVEGYTDVMALAQAGIENVVATMGTALTVQQLKRLSHLTKNLYLCYDADAAGIGAMSRALGLARRLGLTMFVVRIPDGLDPADYVLSGGGADGFRRLAAAAQTLLQFHVRLALATHDLTKPDGRARAFAQLRGVLREAASPIERDEELRYIADRLRLSDESVRYLLAGGGQVAPGDEAAAAGSGTTPQAAAQPAAPGVGARAIGGGHELEVRFLAACLARPGKGRETLGKADDSFFASAETRAAFRAVKARLAPAEAGNTLQTPSNGGEPDEAGEAFAEAVVRAGRGRFTDAVVQELWLRLQEAQVDRVMARLKVALATDDTGEREVELARWEEVRRSLQAARRAIHVDGEPDGD